MQQPEDLDSNNDELSIFKKVKIDNFKIVNYFSINNFLSNTSSRSTYFNNNSAKTLFNNNNVSNSTNIKTQTNENSTNDIKKEFLNFHKDQAISRCCTPQNSEALFQSKRSTTKRFHPLEQETELLLWLKQQIIRSKLVPQSELERFETSFNNLLKTEDEFIFINIRNSSLLLGISGSYIKASSAKTYSCK